MKLKLLFTTIFATASIMANAQITITQNEIAGNYEMIFMATDTISTMYTPGNAGTGQTWSNTFAQVNVEDTLMFMPPIGMPGSIDFPNSNLCYSVAGTDSSWWFFKKDANGLIYKGRSFVDNGQLTTMKYNATVLTFPAEMGTQYNFSGTFTATEFPLGFDPDGAGPHLMVDSVRIIRDIDESSNIDGLGTITTPLGAFQSLRQVVSRIYIDTFLMKTNNGWSLFSPEMQFWSGTGSIDTTEEFITRWWTNELGIRMPVMEMFHNSSGNVYKAKWVKAMAQASVAEVEGHKVELYPNPATDIIHINSDLNEVTTVVIRDAKGAIVSEASLEFGSGQINAGHLDNGIYFMQFLNDSNEQIHSARVSIAK